MPHAQKAAASRPVDRHWYHPRPKPRQRADLLGFNAAWWMAFGWIIAVLVILAPFPWWWL